MNGADVGGIPAVVLNYYQQIDKSKYQFDFVIPPSKLGLHGLSLEKLGGTFYTLPLKSEHLLSFIRDLRKLIKKNHYDVVHAHHHDTSYVALFVAMSCGVKCRVAQSHSYMVDGEGIKTKIRRYVAILLNDLSSNLRFACTDEAASYLFGKHLKRLFPVTILPNGVEPEKFTFSEQGRSLARNEFNIGSKTLVFGIVARMTQEKNHKFLIKVLSSILKIRQDVKLLFVGEGPLREELEQLAAKENVTNEIIFAGRREDLTNMLCAMDVFTLPSFYEGSPVSGVEAAANGLPIILSSAITKDLNFLNNVAYIDIKNSYDKWAEKIIELSKRGRDKNAVRVINQNGFNVRDIVSRLANSYVEIINK